MLTTSFLPPKTIYTGAIMSKTLTPNTLISSFSHKLFEIKKKHDFEAKYIALFCFCCMENELYWVNLATMTKNRLDLRFLPIF